jgi:hypothetical protein
VIDILKLPTGNSEEPFFFAHYEVRITKGPTGQARFGVLYKKKVAFRSPQSMSQLLSPLETEEQQREEIRRIILVKKGGYRGDTFIDSCVAYCLTSLI